MNVRGWLLGAAIAALHGTYASAQPYPVKPIRVIVPFGPGGPTDFLTRIASQKFPEGLGQQLIVDYRAGANGVVGSEQLARAAPDGYTLGMITNGTHGINSSLFAKLPFDPIKDFAPISRMGVAPFLMVAHPSLPVRRVADVITLARARPGELTWSAGGSPTQLASELFKKTTATNFVVVPYKGNALAVTAAISGEVSLTFGNVAQTAPQVKAGRLRAIAIGGLQRSAVLPDVPTVAESGLPGFETGAWYGLAAPAGVPRAVIERMHGETVRVLKLPDVVQRMRGEAYDIIGDTPEQFAQAIRTEIAKWAPIVKQAGI